MANICSDLMEIKGDPEKIAQIKNMWEKKDTALTNLFPYFDFDPYAEYTVHEADFQDSTGSISFSSKWDPPEEDIASFSEKMELEIYLKYEEPGNDVFGEMWFKNGAITDQREYEPQEWAEEFDPTYEDTKASIDSKTYPELLKHFIDDRSGYTGYPTMYLEGYVLSKIKAEDLPLLVHREWQLEENHEAFKQRLAHDR